MTASSELNQMVPAYDELYGMDNRLTQDWYPQRVIALSQGEALLELGMGHGGATAAFAQHFKRYQVVEGSADMIQRFRTRFNLPQVDVHHGFFEDFETEERFDHISMGFVLEHVQDVQAVLRRFRRFLKADGTLFVAVPNADSLHRRIGHASGLLADLKQLSAADQRLGHIRYFNLQSLKQELHQAGFETSVAEGIMLKPFTTPQMEKLDLSAAVLGGLMVVAQQYPELANSLLVMARRRPV